MVKSAKPYPFDPIYQPLRKRGTLSNYWAVCSLDISKFLENWKDKNSKKINEMDIDQIHIIRLDN